MNLLELSQTLGNFGEFVGAIGVVITLGYLALQIRRNTQATQATSHHAITDSLNQGNIAMATDPELTQIYLTGLVDRASLSEVERQRFDSLFLAYFHVFDTLFFSSSNGTGAQSLLLAEEKGFSHLMNLPGIYAWWQDNPFAFTPEFRSYMESFRNTVEENEKDR
ncbi:MAG: hypothetical protein O6945_16205 [Gammaproteobacteria bacterium]|nr:hypothetical protein [Gammaproteobacteria bacterium]